MFSVIAKNLLKGIVYKEDNIKLWQELIKYEDELRDYFSKIDLELIIDKDYAFLEERGEYKLVRKTRLSFFASFLMILLRKELLKENEVVSKEYLIDKIKIYIQTDDEKKVNKLINEAITKIIQLGFLKEINPNIYKIRESVERFIDVKTLQEFDNKFEEYIAYLKEKDAF
jgi:DNA-directed RNA polymerase subunit L